MRPSNALTIICVANPMTSSDTQGRNKVEQPGGIHVVTSHATMMATVMRHVVMNMVPDTATP